MESYRIPAGTAQRKRPVQRREDVVNLGRTTKQKLTSSGFAPGSSLSVGAKTLAGIGLGLLCVMGGAVVVGALSAVTLLLLWRRSASSATRHREATVPGTGPLPALNPWTSERRPGSEPRCDGSRDYTRAAAGPSRRR